MNAPLARHLPDCRHLGFVRPTVPACALHSSLCLRSSAGLRPGVPCLHFKPLRNRALVEAVLEIGGSMDRDGGHWEEGGSTVNPFRPDGFSGADGFPVSCAPSQRTHLKLKVPPLVSLFRAGTHFHFPRRPSRRASRDDGYPVHVGGTSDPVGLSLGLTGPLAV